MSDIPVAGTSIPETAFPRYTGRRFDWDQPVDIVNEFSKWTAEHLDYSVDLYHVLNAAEFVVEAFGQTSAPDELIVSRVNFAHKGAVVWLYGGLHGVTYDLILTVGTARQRVITFKGRVTTWGDPTEGRPTFRPPVLHSADDPAQNYLVDMLGYYVAPTWVDADGVLLTPDFGSDP